MDPKTKYDSRILTLDINVTRVYNSIDQSKVLFFNVQGSPNTTTTLQTSQTSDVTLTLPDASGVLLTDTSSAVLKNKDLSDPSNIVSASSLAGIQIETPTDDDQMLVYDQPTNKWQARSVVDLVKYNYEKLPTSGVNADPDVNKTLTEIVIDGSKTSTLVNGSFPGQIKIITVLVSDSVNTYTLNINTFTQGAGLLFDTASQSAQLVWTSAGWTLMGGSGAEVF